MWKSVAHTTPPQFNSCLICVAILKYLEDYIKVQRYFLVILSRVLTDRFHWRSQAYLGPDGRQKHPTIKPIFLELFLEKLIKAVDTFFRSRPDRQPTTFDSQIIMPSVHDDDINWRHFPRYGPFVRGIHCSSQSFLWSAPGQMVEQTIKAPVIWDAIALIMWNYTWTIWGSILWMNNLNLDIQQTLIY